MQRTQDRALRWLTRRTLSHIADMLDALARPAGRRRAARLVRDVLRLLALWARRLALAVTLAAWGFSLGMPEAKVGYAMAADGSLSPSLTLELWEWGPQDALWAIALEGGASGRFALFGAALVIVPVVELEAGVYAAWDSEEERWTWAVGAGLLRF